MTRPKAIAFFFFVLYANKSNGQALVNTPAPKIQFSVAIGQTPPEGFMAGKTVVLEFWATWCAPCVAAFPTINRFSKQFSSDSVIFVSITSENEVQKVSGFLDKHPLNTINLLDDNRKTIDAYGVESIPATVIIGKNGKIIWQGRIDEIEADTLKELLNGKKMVAEIVVPAQKQANAPPAMFQFSVSKSENQESGWSQGRSLSLGEDKSGHRFIKATAWPFFDMLSNVMNHINPARLITPQDRSDFNIDLSFSIDSTIPDKYLELSEKLLLKSFNFSTRFVERKADVWLLQITDSGLLKKYKSIQLEKKHSGTGVNKEDNTKVFVNNDMNSVCNALEYKYHEIFVTGNYKGTGRYDLIIPNCDKFEDLNDYLKKNVGIHFTKAKKDIRFLQILRTKKERNGM